MLELSDLRVAWTRFQSFETLDALRNDVRLDPSGADGAQGLRSAYWKAFLLSEHNDVESLPASLKAARTAYDALHTRFGTRYVPADDPLAEGTEDQWSAREQDESLRSEILQDIVRLPDDELLRRPAIQTMMLSILFVYCKLNPDLSYRQGMHELLAPILIVVEHDACEIDEHTTMTGTDTPLITWFDAKYIEHDAFILFSRVMQSAKNFYEQTSHHAAENPLISRSSRITHDLLGQADAQLSRHLTRLAIPPQLYLMRWIRLLFGREFERNDLLGMWDIIFAEDPTLDIVDNICLVMLLRIRWHLLEADYNGALALLLRYSADETKAKTVAVDALHLRDRLTPATGQRLIVKYTGRTPEELNRRTITPPAVQRNVTAISGMNVLKSAFRTSSELKGEGDQLSGMEVMLQNTARNIYNKSEQLGIGKAVRTAVEDIHRRAQQLRDVEPSPPRLISPRQRQSVQNKLVELNERNKRLALLLEQSTACLWDIQKQLSETSSQGTPQQVDLEELSMAIGKVQFVQLHLEDSTLRLEQRDVLDESSENRDSQSTIQPSSSETLGRSLRGEIIASSAGMELTHASNIVSPAALGSTVSLQHAEDTVPTSQKVRPPLSETSYSWMLGQNHSDGLPARSSRPDNLFG